MERNLLLYNFEKYNVNGKEDTSIFVKDNLFHTSDVEFALAVELSSLIWAPSLKNMESPWAR